MSEVTSTKAALPSAESVEADKIFDGPARTLLNQVGIELRQQVIGNGGYSHVFAGLFCGQECAIKISKESIASSDPLQRELERLPTIWPLTKKHPYITTLLWFGKIPTGDTGEPHLCTVWDRAETTFGSHVPTSEASIVNQLICVAEALDFLHHRKVIHRDVKPANILLISQGEGQFEAQLADLGLARIVVATHGATTAGTLGYGHPEQLAGRTHACCDVYSLAWVYLDALWRLKKPNMQRDVKNPRHTIDVLTELIPSQSVRELIQKIVVLDGKRDESTSAIQLFHTIAKNTKYEDMDSVDKVLSFSISNAFAPKTLFADHELSPTGLDRNCLAFLSGLAIGTVATKLPKCIGDNVDVVGVFRAKELANELRVFLKQVLGAAKGIQSTTRFWAPEDNDSILRERQSEIKSVGLRLRERSEQEGTVWSTYDQMVRNIFDRIDDASSDFTLIFEGSHPKRLLPENQREQRFELPKTTQYNERRVYYQRTAQLLIDGLAPLESEAGLFYVKLCNLLGGN